MSIYKPSQHSPNLQEIDATESNTFSCLINTSGEPVKAYKLDILSKDGSKTAYEGVATNTAHNIYNKKVLQMTDINTDYNISNGNDYQWNVRVYNQVVGATTQPNTLVTEGYLVGSTKYVVWMRMPDHGQDGENKDIADNIIYDRYIEIAANSEKEIVLGAKDDVDHVKPTIYPYTQRLKIDWVTKEVGDNKDIIKIETTDPFDYNYIDGQRFSIYRCSGEQSVNSLFADPNSSVNSALYIIVYNTLADAQASIEAEDTPLSITVTPADCMIKTDADSGEITYSARKIMGYSSDTGEMRVHDAFNVPPVNGQYYRIFKMKYDVTEAGTYAPEDDDNIKTHKVGGFAIDEEATFKTRCKTYFKVVSNRWDSKGIRLFMQPNINIKADATNPNEVVFENGTRLDILEQYWNNTETSDGSVKKVDVTFNKLDNTQWLIENSELSTATGTVYTTKTPIGTIPYEASSGYIQPQTPYTVYTDFMDTMPNNIFYARKTPTVLMRGIYVNGDYNDGGKDIIVNETTSITHKDIQFYLDNPFASKYLGTEFNTKYYNYKLYDEDGTLIDSSDDVYATGTGNAKIDDAQFDWYYRGFEDGKAYTLVFTIVDDYNKSFEFTYYLNVSYDVTASVVPIGVELDCNEQAVVVTINEPTWAITTNDQKNDIATIDTNNIVQYTDAEKEVLQIGEEGATLYSTGYVSIPENKTLNYTTVKNEEETPIVISRTFSLLTQFQITSDFVDNIYGNDKKEVFQVAYKRYDYNEFSTGNVYSVGDMVIYKDQVYLCIVAVSNAGPWTGSANWKVQTAISPYTIKHVALDLTGVDKYYYNGAQVESRDDLISLSLRCDDSGTNTTSEEFYTLDAWNGNNYYSLMNTPIGSGVKEPTDIFFALQDINQYYQTNVVDLDTWNTYKNRSIIYTGPETYYEEKFYEQGIYVFNESTNSWNISSAESLFLENEEQLPTGETSESMKVPDNVINDDGTYSYVESNNRWLENLTLQNHQSTEAFNNYWFELYLVMDWTEDGTKPESSASIKLLKVSNN